MTPEECRGVLALIAGYDGRTVDAPTIMAWHKILEPLTNGVALEAVRLWYTENRGYIQPADVVSYAARIVGADRRPTVTQQRLDGVMLPWDHQRLGSAWIPKRQNEIERQEHGEEK